MTNRPRRAVIFGRQVVLADRAPAEHVQRCEQDKEDHRGNAACNGYEKVPVIHKIWPRGNESPEREYLPEEKEQREEDDRQSHENIVESAARGHLSLDDA